MKCLRCGEPLVKGYCSKCGRYPDSGKGRVQCPNCWAGWFPNRTKACRDCGYTLPAGEAAKKEEREAATHGERKQKVKAEFKQEPKKPNLQQKISELLIQLGPDEKYHDVENSFASWLDSGLADGVFPDERPDPQYSLATKMKICGEVLERYEALKQIFNL